MNGTSRSLPNQTSYIPSSQRQQQLAQQTTKHAQGAVTPLFLPQYSPSNPNERRSHSTTELQDAAVTPLSNAPQTTEAPPSEPLKISCTMLKGTYTILPINNPTLLSSSPSGLHHGHHYGPKQSHSLDLTLLTQVLTTTHYPLNFATDEEGALDLAYNTTSQSVLSQSATQDSFGYDEYCDIYSTPHSTPLTSITRLSPADNSLSLITSIDLLRHLTHHNPLLTNHLHLPQDGGADEYVAIEIVEGSEALDMTGFIGALTNPLVEQLGLNTIAYISTYHTDIILIPLCAARIAFSHLIKAVESLSENSSTNFLPSQPRLLPQSHEHKNRTITINPLNSVTLSCYPISWLQYFYAPLFSILLNLTIHHQARAPDLVDAAFQSIYSEPSPSLPPEGNKADPSTASAALTTTTTSTSTTNLTKLVKAIHAIQHQPALYEYIPRSLFSIVLTSHSITLFSEQPLTMMFLSAIQPLLLNDLLHPFAPPALSLLAPAISASTPSPDDEQPPQQQEQEGEDNPSPPLNPAQLHLATLPRITTVSIHPASWDIYSSSATGTYFSLVKPVSTLLASNLISLVYLSTHNTDLLLCMNHQQDDTIRALEMEFTIDVDE